MKDRGKLINSAPNPVLSKSPPGFVLITGRTTQGAGKEGKQRAEYWR